jgi:hypothetical protein
MTSRLKIDVLSGLLEVEGSEDFIIRMYEDVRTSGYFQNKVSTSSSESREEPERDAKPTKGRRAPSKRGGPSCAERILELVSAGFFDAPKSASEIKAGLEQNGHAYAGNQVGAALTNLYQRGSLRRLKPGKEWVYQQP